MGFQKTIKSLFRKLFGITAHSIRCFFEKEKSNDAVIETRSAFPLRHAKIKVGLWQGRAGETKRRIEQVIGREGADGDSFIRLSVKL
jgi:hypothetical protein